MKKRTLLLLALVLLAVLAWWLARRDTGSTLAGPLTDFAIKDTAAVDRIFIADNSGATIDLERVGDHWTVNGEQKAKQSSVDLLLKTFLRIEVRSPVPESAMDNVLKVMGSSARKVEIYTGGSEPEKIWYVGHGTPDHFGTYMLLELPGKGRSDEPFIMGMTAFSGVLNTRFHLVAEDWRSSEVFVYPDLTRIARVEVRHPVAPGSGFTVERLPDGELRLLDEDGLAVPFDTATVKDLMLQFKGLYFEAVETRITAQVRDSVLASVPYHTVAVVDVEGRRNAVTFFLRPEFPDGIGTVPRLKEADVDRMYALLEDSTLVIVQRLGFDRITPPLNLLQ